MGVLVRRGVVVLLVAVLAGTGHAGRRGPLCNGSFLGCRTRVQKVRFCRGACRTFRSVCTTTFRQSGLRRRCVTAQVAACLGAGGTCASGACGVGRSCPAAQVCLQGVCIVKPPDRCGGGVCPAKYPNCGPDGRCWTEPCSQLCGTGCCGGEYPVCGGDGLCHLGIAAGVTLPDNLTSGNYGIDICASGTVVLPCQQVGTIPYENLGQFENAFDAAIDGWLAATASFPDCTPGAASTSAFDGSRFTVAIGVTCTAPDVPPVNETITVTAQRL